jgi:cytochrome c
MKLRAWSIVGIGWLCSAAATVAATPAEQRGQTFAINNCAKCHAIAKVGPSPLAIAPPLRDLHKRYPIEDLARVFAEGIHTDQPTMPVFQLPPDQINDLLAYLRSLE